VVDPHAGAFVEAGGAGAVLAVDVEVDLANPAAVELAEPVAEQGQAEAPASMVVADGQLGDVPTEGAGLGEVDPDQLAAVGGQEPQARVEVGALQVDLGPELVAAGWLVADVGERVLY
jgi:hypothetical protein